ncbi:hypothetical protein ACTWQL_00140 [Pseudalkalibacillus sp. R45]|uniref:hypothetical protein n=1 Tax=Pseudalkalibacillus sp. R45 TaxID=3457433 RepID=UPI003FCE86C7
MVSPVPLIPLESRTLLSNQLAQGDLLKIAQKQKSFRKEPLQMILRNSLYAVGFSWLAGPAGVSRISLG